MVFALKFGGTSVKSVERLEAVAERVIAIKNAGNDIVVVVSAMSGEINRLIALAEQVQAQPTPRELGVLVSTGEQVIMALLTMALHKRGCAAKLFTGANSDRRSVHTCSCQKN